MGPRLGQGAGRGEKKLDAGGEIDTRTYS